MQIIDSIKVEGFLRIRGLDADGLELWKMEKPNLVCVGAIQAITRLLAQQGTPPEDYEETKIWAIHVGTDNTSPVTADLDLGSAVYAAICDQPYTVDLGTGEVEVQMTVPISGAVGGGDSSGNANGSTLVEAGLFTRGDNDTPSYSGPVPQGQLMMAHQVHGAIEKTSSFAVEYTWKFRISS